MYGKCERGSVLMEFILVIPVYVALFGGLFAIGEMSLKSIGAAHADRVAAFDVCSANPSWGDAVKAIFRTADSGTSSPVVKFQTPHYAADAIEGPWTVCAGAVAADCCKAPVWTRGWLASSDGFFSGAAKSQPLDPGDSGLGALAGGNRVEIVSKPRTGKGGGPDDYAHYYTLKRVKPADGSGNLHWRSMRRHASSLVNAAVADNPRWSGHVEFEPWHDGISHDRNGCGRVNVADSRDEYTRYSQFERWSR